MINCQEFITDIVTHLTGEKPDIQVQEDEHGAVLTVTVSGKVSSLIGRNGTTIDAIRTLVKAVGYNGKHRIKVRIYEQRTN